MFAELAKEFVNWQQGLEGLEMQESTVVQGWINRGVERGALSARRAWLLEAIRTRLQDPIPESVRLAVEGTNDLAVLEQWFKAALTAGTIAELRSAMRQEP